MSCWGFQLGTERPMCWRLWLATWLAVSVACWNQVEVTRAQTTWPRFRGQQNDGHVSAFPQASWQPRLLWQTPLPTQGVGGVAATADFVVTSGRTADDAQDLFVCLDPTSGAELWRLTYPAPGTLDYGNSPRATPLIADPQVYLLGAMGDFSCVDLDSGEVRWRKHLVKDLGGVLPTWGYGWSPLLADGKLIVMPGGPTCSIAALDPDTGDVLWQTGGQPTAYASPVLAAWNHRPQIVTYDRATLGGWSLDDGQRLWSIQPPKPNDFNVPTPIVLPHSLLVVSENNGLRQYGLDAHGLPKPEPLAMVKQLVPDSHSPVVVGKWLVAAERELMVLDIEQQLSIAWRKRDRALRGHNSLIAAGDQVLVISQSGELLLVKVAGAESEIVARHTLGNDARYLLAHPALAEDILYVRAEQSLQAWALWQASGD